MEIIKLSETEYQKTVTQPDLVITKTLDNLLAEQASLEVGIQNNKDRITEQEAKLDEVLLEIVGVKNLGVKTQTEATPVAPIVPTEPIIP